MGKGYIYNESGKLVEELDYSCDGGEMMYCAQCCQTTWHQLIAVSNVRGYVYACSDCGWEG